MSETPGVVNGDPCPNCGQKQLPKWGNALEKARACQACGTVQERNDPVPVSVTVVVQPVTPSTLPRYRAIVTPRPKAHTPANSPTEVIPPALQIFTSALRDIDQWAVEIFRRMSPQARASSKVEVYRVIEEKVKEITFVADEVVKGEVAGK